LNRQAVRQVLERSLEILETGECWAKGFDAYKMQRIAVCKHPDSKLDYRFPVTKKWGGDAMPPSWLRFEETPTPTHPMDPDADHWCAQGAVIKAVFELTEQNMNCEVSGFSRELIRDTMHVLGQQVPQEWLEAETDRLANEEGDKPVEIRSIVRYNDSKDVTFEDVRLAFKKGLASLDD
jgi:hypothetical protein